MSAPAPTLADSTVLVVEDDTIIQQTLIAHLLNDMGITRIEFAEDGVAGLAKAKEHRFDLIVTDIVMPLMDGFEMLAHLRADALLSRTPVIVQTALDSGDSRDQMFSAGATDFVSKPLSQAEFQGRVRVHLENKLLVTRLEDQLDRMARELEDAAALQKALLPTPGAIARVRDNYGLKVSYRFEPSSALGGDFWGMFPINDHALALYICDFAGHGTSAALNTIRLHTTLDRLPPPNPDDPADFLGQINLALCGTLTNRHYATLLFGVVDVNRNTFTYAAAGAPNPVKGAAGGGAELIDASGMPVGISRTAKFDNRVVEFPAGAFMLFYSDAMNESRRASGELVESGGVSQIANVAQSRRDPSADPLDIVMSEFHRQVAELSEDDLTLVWIEKI